MSVLKPYRVKRTPLSKKLRIILPALGIAIGTVGAVLLTANGILKNAKSNYIESEEKVITETEQEKVARQTADVEKKGEEAISFASSNDAKGVINETVSILEDLVETGHAEEETINQAFDVASYVNDFVDVVRELPAILGNNKLSQSTMRTMMSNKIDLMDECDNNNPKDFLTRLDEELYDYKYQTCFIEEMSYEERMTINAQCRDIRNVLITVMNNDEYNSYSDMCQNLACCYFDFSYYCFANEEVDIASRAIELYEIYHRSTNGDCVNLATLDACYLKSNKSFTKVNEDGTVEETIYSDMDFESNSPKNNLEYFLDDNAHNSYVLTIEGRNAINTVYGAFSEYITRFNKVLELDGNLDNPREGANLQLAASSLIYASEMLFTQYDDICYYLSENDWAFAYFSDSYVSPDVLLGSPYYCACASVIEASAE